MCKGWSWWWRTSIKYFWFKKREKTGHLPLSIVEQGGLNPDYGPSKMLCVGVCEGVFVSVACCQSVLGSIEKQQVSRRATGDTAKAAKNLFTAENIHPSRVNSPTTSRWLSCWRAWLGTPCREWVLVVEATKRRRPPPPIQPKLQGWPARSMKSTRNSWWRRSK